VTTPIVPRKTRPLATRFWAMVDKTGGPEACWLWLGSKSKLWGGYGTCYVGGGRQNTIRQQAHRVAYELVVGPIPEGLEIDHLCRNRACVNPTHLEAVTQQVNQLRGVGPQAKKAVQTHCIHGHELFGENVYIKKNGCRMCRTCARINSKTPEQMAKNALRGQRRRARLRSTS
jgi:hypothetical protein